jgi:hypothetical protein
MNQAILNRSRIDKFSIVLDLPKYLKDNIDNVLQSSYNADSIQFTVIGSPVPAIQIPQIKVPFGGQAYNTSSNSRPAYEPLDLNFFLDNGYQNYWILWKWLNLFNDVYDSTTQMIKPLDLGSNVLTNPMNDFRSNFTIYGEDEFNNKIISFHYEQAFIIGLSEIKYSFQSPEEATCNAKFVFNRLTVELLKDVNVSSC